MNKVSFLKEKTPSAFGWVGGGRLKKRQEVGKGDSRLEHTQAGGRVVQKDLRQWRRVFRGEQGSRGVGTHFLESASGVEMAGVTEPTCFRSFCRTGWLAFTEATPELGPALQVTGHKSLLSLVVKNLGSDSSGLKPTNTWGSSFRK